MAVDMIARGMAASASGSSGGATIGVITTPTSWNGAKSPYSQTITVAEATVTENSKVDLQPSPLYFSILGSDGVTAMLVENNNGTLTLFAYGETPTSGIPLQCTVTEV